MNNLHPRLRKIWLAQNIAIAITATIATALARHAFTSIQIPLPEIAMALAILIFGSIYQLKRYQNWRYEIRSDHAYIEYGVLIHVKKQIPYVRVQHVDSRRGVIERLTGLASVVIYTAGSRGADITIPGLLPKEANELREELKDLVVEDEDRWNDAV